MEVTNERVLVLKMSSWPALVKRVKKEELTEVKTTNSLSMTVEETSTLSELRILISAFLLKALTSSRTIKC